MSVPIFVSVNRVPGDEREITNSYNEGMEIEQTYIINDKTEFDNINSIKEISEGQIVSIEYTVDESGKKIINNINIKKALPKRK